MRLHSETVEEVETSGLAETTNFSIKVTGKAFKILLDGLYADKPAAVIRELATNAYDGHLAIGKGDVPFDVQLPTIWDPTYRIRDYGVSMTHEQAMRLMSTIFDSTKDQSNTQVGAFGLGSKSPFSLVDSFSLNVIKDGEKRMYSAFIKPDGVPTLALLGREATTEPQGVEFILTIESKDIRAFRERAIRILRWFPTHPNVWEGKQKLDLPQAETLLTGKGWMLLKHGDPAMTANVAYARQGCVMYPLNSSSIPNITEAHKALLSAPLVIDFAIGSLDVAASREALSYEETTCANIAARLNLVSKEITDHYGTAIKDAPTIWEAGKKRREIARGSGLPQALVRIVTQTKWKDLIVPDEIKMPSVVKYLKDKHGIEVTPYYWDRYRVTRSDTAVYFDYNSESHGRRWEWEYGDENLHIFFTVAGERPTYEGRRIRETITQTYSDKGILLFVLAKADDAKLVMEALGSPPIQPRWTKDLAAPNIVRNGPAPKRGTTKKEEVKVRKIENDPKTGWTVRDETVTQLDGTAYYAILREGKVRDLGPQKDLYADPDTFLKAIGAASKCGYLPAEPIYLISTVYQKRIEKFIEEGGAWKQIDTFVCEKATDFADKLFAEAETNNVKRHVANCNWAMLLTSDSRFKTLAERLKVGPLYGLHNTLQAFGLYGSQPASVTNFMEAVYPLRAFGVKSSEAQSDVQKKLNSSSKLSTLHLASRWCSEAYPLVANMRSYDMRGNVTNHVIDYIEAIDLLRASKAALKVA